MRFPERVDLVCLVGVDTHASWLCYPAALLAALVAPAVPWLRCGMNGLPHVAQDLVGFALDFIRSRGFGEVIS